MGQADLLGKIEFQRPYTIIELAQLNETNISTAIRNVSNLRKFSSFYGIRLNESWKNFTKTTPYGMTDLEITRDYKRKLYVFSKTEE